MPEGPLGGPRLNNLGPLSRSTEEEIRQHWEPCPDSGKQKEICEEIKVVALAILEDQGFYARCDELVDINSGFCSAITKKVSDRVSGVRIYQAGDRDHLWIFYGGRHYDAEVPSGLDDWRDLPFFARIPPKEVLRNARMAAEAEGREPPETFQDTIKDVTNEHTR